MGFVRYPDGDSGMFPDYRDPVNLDDHLTGAYVFVNLIWIYKKKSTVLDLSSNYGHTMAKSQILCSPNSNPYSKEIFGIWMSRLVFF